MSDAALPDHSDVIVFPPLIPLSGFVTGVLLERLHPVAVTTSIRIAGAVIFLGGALGFAWMVVTMKRARTPIHNARTPTALVETGPFGLTRNPMYLFGAVAYAGAALATQHVYSLALLPIVQLVLHFGVVQREEEYLRRRFGEAYRRYCARVPRWL